MLLAYLCEVQSAYSQGVHGLMWSGVEGESTHVLNQPLIPVLTSCHS